MSTYRFLGSDFLTVRQALAGQNIPLLWTATVDGSIVVACDTDLAGTDFEVFTPPIEVLTDSNPDPEGVMSAWDEEAV